jgi:hypothetical protein
MEMSVYYFSCMHTNALVEDQQLLRRFVECILAGHNIDGRDQTVCLLDFALRHQLSDVMRDVWRTHLSPLRVL